MARDDPGADPSDERHGSWPGSRYDGQPDSQPAVQADGQPAVQADGQVGDRSTVLPDPQPDAPGSTDAARLKATLRRLAGPDAETVIRRADRAVEDLDDSVAFLESVGLEDLDAALEAIDDPDLEQRGRRAIALFRRFGRVAVGTGADRTTDDAADSGVHFRRGRGTDLRRGDEPPGR